MEYPAVPRPTIIRYLVLLSLCTVTVINYVQRNAINGVEKVVAAELKLDKNQISAAIAEFFLTYALFQIPSGWLAQRWGTRRALTLFTIGWSLATAGLALAHGVEALRGLRLIMGACQAGIFPCATLIVAAWLPLSRRGFASGILNACMVGGTALGNLLVGLLVNYLGWRGLMLAFAVPGILWAIWFYLWFTERPADHSGVNDSEQAIIAAGRDAVTEPATGHRVPWLAIAMSLTMILIGVQQFCRAGANRMIERMPRYLEETRRLTTAEANVWSSMPQIAGVLGSLLGGWISDYVLRRTGRRRLGRNGVAVASLAISSGLYLFAYSSPRVEVAVSLISLAFLISTFASPCAYALTMDVGGRNTAVVFSTMNMLGNIGAWASHRVVGMLLERSPDWDPILAVYLGLHLVPLLCWLILKPNVVIGEISDVSKKR